MRTLTSSLTDSLTYRHTDFQIHSLLVWMCVSKAWQKARSEGWERSFCEKNFLSQATMELVLSLRVQLLGQLRAIGPSLTLKHKTIGLRNEVQC